VKERREDEILRGESTRNGVVDGDRLAQIIRLLAGEMLSTQSMPGVDIVDAIKGSSIIMMMTFVYINIPNFVKILPAQKANDSAWISEISTPPAERYPLIAFINPSGPQM
jgi:hypothetical protein